MTFQPFSSGYLQALTQQTVPDMTQTFAQGRKAREEQNRLLAQQEAADMIAAGDRQGGINRLLSVADPGEALRYQIALENQQSETARQGVLDQRYAAEQKQQTERYNAQQEHQAAMLEIQRKQEERAAAADRLRQPITLDQFSGSAPLAAPPAGGMPQQPVGPANPEYAPPPPQPPPAPPPQAMAPSPTTIPGAEAGAGNMDLPMVPGITGPPAGQPPQQVVGQAVQAQVAPQQQSASNLPPWMQGLPKDKQDRIMALFNAGQATREEVNKIIAESPRQATLSPEFQMQDKLRDDWRQETLPFQKRVEGYRDFQQSYSQAIKMDKTSGPAAVATVYSFLKNMDPAGAVLTSDVEMAQKSAGWWTQATNIVNSMEGNFVPKTVLEGMKRQVDARYGAAFDSYQQREKMYREQVKNQYGLDPYSTIEDQTGGVRPPKDWANPAPAGAAEQGQGGIQPGQSAAGAIVQQYMPEFMQRFQQRFSR